jgi:hypothetical protein
MQDTHDPSQESAHMYVSFATLDKRHKFGEAMMPDAIVAGVTWRRDPTASAPPHLLGVETVVL